MWTLDAGTYVIDLSALEDLEVGDKVLVQVPEGLMTNVRGITKAIQSRLDLECIISAQPTFGACDVPLAMARDMGIDVVLHVGHLPLGGVDYGKDVKVVFARAEMKVDIDRLEGYIEDLADTLRQERKGWVSVVTTAQHLGIIEKVKKRLVDGGIEAVVGCGITQCKGRCSVPGIVLGCSFANATPHNGGGRVEAVVFVGTGRFHPLGILMATGMEVYALNPLSGLEVFRMGERERFIRKRFAAIERCLNAKDYGIIISSKVGQCRMGLANALMDLGQRHGKNTLPVIADEVKPGYMDALGFDALVNTACPRLAYDDYFRFKTPILTPWEFEVAVGARAFDHTAYRFDVMD